MHHVTESKNKQGNANTLCKGVRAESCAFTWDHLQAGQYVQHIILSYMQISFSSESIYIHSLYMLPFLDISLPVA